MEMHKQMSVEDRAGAFLTAAATAGDIKLMNQMSLIFPTARGEKHHEKALRAALHAGQLDAAKALIKLGVDPTGTHQPYGTRAASAASISRSLSK